MYLCELSRSKFSVTSSNVICTMMLKTQFFKSGFNRFGK